MAAFTLQAHYSSCACFMIEATQSLAMLCGRSKEHHAKASLIFKSVRAAVYAWFGGAPAAVL
eukprot:scaffold63185_cov15-Tisochrysis_lutea.AAC.1